MDDSKDDIIDDHPLPSGILPDVQAVLRKLILENPEAAWDYLHKDPLAVIGLPKVKREIQKILQENPNQFQDDYDKKVDDLFILEDLIHTNGVALTIEFLIERWRRQNERLFIDRETGLLLENLFSIKSILSKDKKISNKKILLDMVNDSIRRISSFEEYEHQKAEENWSKLEPVFGELVKHSLLEIKMFSGTNSTNLLDAWLSLATMKHTSAEVLRKGLAKLLLTQLESEFVELDEEMKFKFAPWIPLLKKIVN